MKKIISLCVAVLLSGCGGGSSAPATNSLSSPPPAPPAPPPSANQAPIAYAGSDQIVDEGAVVNLAGTGTDADGSIASFSWQQVGGAGVAISSADTANGTFMAPMVSSTEVLEFLLKVTDNNSTMGSDTVKVTINDVSASGTADLGALIASSDSRFVSEVAALESEQDSAQAQAVAAGTYLSGGYLSSARSRLINHVDAFFNFVSGEAIMLTNNGTQFSYTDVTTLLDSYRSLWQTFLDEFLASSLFSGHSSNSLNSIDAEVLIFIQDKINSEINYLDGLGILTAPSQPSNVPPTANAGVDKTVDEGTTVSLSGSGTDSDGFIASYNWLQDSGPAIVITDADMQFASFVAPIIEVNQEMVFRFIVVDDDGAIGSDTVTISVNSEPTPNTNQPPTADAGVDQNVDEGMTVSLFGAGTDSDGTIASYSWEQVSGTGVPLLGGDTANASFTAPGVAETEELVFRLTVTDNDGAVGSDMVTITVNDVPPPTTNLDWSIELNDPSGLVVPTRTLMITGSLINSPTSTENLGVIGGFLGVPPGFDYEVGGVTFTSSGYLFNWSPNGADSFIEQFEGVNLAPGESFDFEFASLAPNESVTPGITYTASLELQLFDAPRPGPMIGSSLDSVSWTVVDGFGLVFVTNTTFDGDLGGFQGADDKCNAEATAAGLAGTYVAWLSDSTTDAKDRIKDQGYITMAGDVVATSLADLIDGTIGVPINVDASGNSIPVVGGGAHAAWTHTTSGGIDFGQSFNPEGDACVDWTSTDGEAVVGSIRETGVQWTGGVGQLKCDLTHRLYCFSE